jgi:hypothetical protein
MKVTRSMKLDPFVTPDASYGAKDCLDYLPEPKD